MEGTQYMFSLSPESRPNPYLQVIEIMFKILHGGQTKFLSRDTGHIKLVHQFAFLW